MEKLTKLITTVKNACGSCSTSACSSCSPVQPAKTLISRRSFGGIVLAASAAPFFIKRTYAQQPVPSASAAPLAGMSQELNVVQKSKGPVMTMLEEFYKMGPGPSSSHTMGPMRITYDFFQRVSKLPQDQLQRATALKVHLFGSLSATGQGHGTDRASLAGLLGKAPATCPPEFLDGLASNPDQMHKVTIGPTSLNLSLKDIIFDETKGEFHHPNTMTAKLMAGNETLYELEYYSVGGGFIEWKGYKAPDKGKPKYPYVYAKDFKKYLIDDKIPLGKILLENEMAISGKSEKEINEFLDQVIEVMVRGVDTGLKVESVLPGPIKLHSKAAAMHRNLQKSSKGGAGQAITKVASYGFAMGEENARGHIRKNS
jgi:L-serine dehydratase